MAKKTQEDKEEKQYSMDDFEKAYGKYVGREINLNTTSTNDAIKMIPRTTSGSLALDIDIGGGYPAWRINYIIGYESSGKSYHANKFLAPFTQRGEKVYLSEPEHVWDEFWGVQCGINLKNVKMSDCEYAEQELDMVEMAIKSKLFKAVCIDSIAALIPKVVGEESLEKATVAKIANICSVSFKKIQAALDRARRENREIYLFMTNQWRQKIGFMVSGFTEPGGNAVKFYPSIKIDLKKESNITDSGDETGEIIGQTSAYTIIKNKTFPPLKTGFSHIIFDGNMAGEFDNHRALAELGIKYGIIEKAGSWYEGKWVVNNTGEQKKVQGINAITKLFATYDVDLLNNYVEELAKIALPDRQLCFRF